MKDTSGKELIKDNILKRKFSFFDIKNSRNATVAGQYNDIAPEDAVERFDEICQYLPSGRYTVIVSNNCDSENGRVLKGHKGSSAFENTLIIGNDAHIDKNSHNATNISLEQYLNKVKEVHTLEMRIAELERKLENKENDGGINGILNNPNVQTAIIQMFAGMAGGANQQAAQINGIGEEFSSKKDIVYKYFQRLEKVDRNALSNFKKLVELAEAKQGVYFMALNYLK